MEATGPRFAMTPTSPLSRFDPLRAALAKFDAAREAVERLKDSMLASPEATVRGNKLVLNFGEGAVNLDLLLPGR